LLRTIGHEERSVDGARDAIEPCVAERQLSGNPGVEL
jgi:hypothetical protein